MKWYAPTRGQLVSEIYAPKPSGYSANTTTNSSAGAASSSPVLAFLLDCAVLRGRRRAWGSVAGRVATVGATYPSSLRSRAAAPAAGQPTAPCPDRPLPGWGSGGYPPG